MEAEEPVIYPATVSNAPLQEVPVPQESPTSISPFARIVHTGSEVPQ